MGLRDYRNPPPLWEPYTQNPAGSQGCQEPVNMTGQKFVNLTTFRQVFEARDLVCTGGEGV